MKKQDKTSNPLFGRMAKLIKNEKFDAMELQRNAMLLRKYAYNSIDLVLNPHTDFRTVKHLIHELSVWKQRVYKKKCGNRPRSGIQL